MQTQQNVLLAAVFLIVFACVYAAMRLLRPNALQRRLDQIGRDGTSSDNEKTDGKPQAWLAKLIAASQPLAKLSQQKDDATSSSMRLRFVRAGWRSTHAPALYAGAKTALAIGLPVMGLAALSFYLPNMPRHLLWFVLLLTGALGFYLPNVILARHTEVRQRAIFEDFPDAIDLVTVCVEAGLGLDAALMRVVEEMHISAEALAEEFQLLLLELRAGLGRELALRNLATRTGVDDVETFVSMLIQADRFGTSVGDSLRVLADTLRTKRRLFAEERAAKIALKLLFPLIFFIFPSLLTVLLGPALIRIYRVLMPTLLSM